jgi:hypothetical protein
MFPKVECDVILAAKGPRAVSISQEDGSLVPILFRLRRYQGQGQRNGQQKVEINCQYNLTIDTYIYLSLVVVTRAATRNNSRRKVERSRRVKSKEIKRTV